MQSPIKVPGTHESHAQMEAGDSKVKRGSIVPWLKANTVDSDRLGS